MRPCHEPFLLFGTLLAGSGLETFEASASMEMLEIGCHALEGEPAALVRVFCAINRANEYIPSIGGWRIRSCLNYWRLMMTRVVSWSKNTTCLKFLPLLFFFFNLRIFHDYYSHFRHVKWLSEVNLVIWSRLRLPVELQSFNWPSPSPDRSSTPTRTRCFLPSSIKLLGVKGLDNVARAHVLF